LDWCRQTPEATFQTLLGLGSAHAAVRRKTIIRASDQPYYYAGDETANDEAGPAHLHAHIVPRFVDDPDPGRPPRFMMEDHDLPLIHEGDYRSQLQALRDLSRP
jgi:hypothetical protein